MEKVYDDWIEKFMMSWKNLEGVNTVRYFSKDCKYYENPLDNPCSTFEEIEKLWEVVEENQKDIEYTYEILCYNEDVCIVNWKMKRLFIPNNTIQSIDGIFEIKLNKDGLCNYFKQWRYTR